MTRDDVRARIADLAAQGRRLRNRIQTTAGLERHALWNDKRAVGRQARAALLAYGFLRGVPYSRIEPHCRPGGRLRTVQLLTTWAHDLSIQPTWMRRAPMDSEPHGSGGLSGFFKRLIASRAPAEDKAPETWSETRVAAWLEVPAGEQSQEAAVR